MATFTGPERASCVFWFEDSKSATTVQRNFRTKYAKDPPSRPTIYEWHKCFVETGCSAKHRKSSGRPNTSDEVVEQMRQRFANSPTKSKRGASRELQVSHTTVWYVVADFKSSNQNTQLARSRPVKVAIFNVTAASAILQ